MTSTPSSEIVQNAPPHEVASYFAYALLDIFARLTVDRSLNEIFNETDKIELIDHKRGETHSFVGSIENKQLKFEVSVTNDSDFKMPKRGRLKYSEGENYSTKFDKFLDKLSSDIKGRFEEKHEIIK